MILVSGTSSMALCPARVNVLFLLALGPGTCYAEPTTQMVYSDSSPLGKARSCQLHLQGDSLYRPHMPNCPGLRQPKEGEWSCPVAPPKTSTRWETGAGGGEQLDDICYIIALEGFEKSLFNFPSRLLV